MSLEAELEAFAAEFGAKRRGPQCRVCALPDANLRAVIEEGSERGKTRELLAAYLKSKGYDIGEWTVGHHMRKHVKR